MQGHSQAADILRYLKRRGSITPAEAIEHMGCFRLAARIYELRCDGYNIVTVPQATRKPGGQYAEYRLLSHGRKGLRA